MIDHFVYLSHTSGLKVGITRGTQVPTRWIDQGATQALPLFRVGFAAGFGAPRGGARPGDRRQDPWQAMLKGESRTAGPAAERRALCSTAAPRRGRAAQEHGLQMRSHLNCPSEATTIDYPVLEYPVKVKSLNFDKHATCGRYAPRHQGPVPHPRHGCHQHAQATPATR
jgi:hypothetical protein